MTLDKICVWYITARKPEVDLDTNFQLRYCANTCNGKSKNCGSYLEVDIETEELINLDINFERRKDANSGR